LKLFFPCCKIAKGGDSMINREMQKYQEDTLFEIHFAHQLLSAKKIEEYVKYLDFAMEKAKSGMTAEEIDAVIKRAEDSAKKFIK
jgi:hypothetical protein